MAYNVIMLLSHVGWNYISISKLQRLHRWSLEKDKLFNPTIY